MSNMSQDEGKIVENVRSQLKSAHMKKRRTHQVHQQKPIDEAKMKFENTQELDGLFSPLFDEDFAQDAEMEANEDKHVLFSNNNCVRFSIQHAVTGKSTPSVQMQQEESEQEYRRRRTTDLPTKEASSSQLPAPHEQYSQM